MYPGTYDPKKTEYSKPQENPYERKEEGYKSPYGMKEESFKGPETEERREKVKKGLFSKDPPKQNPAEQKDAPQQPVEGKPQEGEPVVATSGDSEENVIDYRSLKHGDYELHVLNN